LSAKLNLLLTNDDGVTGSGLLVLAKILEKVANVYVLAPDSNRSGVSNHLSIEDELVIKKVSDRFYSCSGYPVDCTITGLVSGLFPVKFDAVISGINQGPNLGTDLLYSGTAAAARQAVLYDVPGVAVSLGLAYEKKTFDFEPLAQFVANNLETLISLSDVEKGLFVNVNAPHQKVFNDVVFAPLSVRKYNDSLDMVARNDENLYGKVEGGRLDSLGPEQCDYQQVKKGNVVISLIPAEPVSYDLYPDVRFKL